MKRGPSAILAAIVLVVCLIIAALLLALGGAREVFGGVRRPTQSPHVVVDTLNLAHWLGAAGAPLTPGTITGAVDATAAALKAQYPGRVMYVVKDRESDFLGDEARAAYGAAAARNGVYIYVVEKYPDPPAVAKQLADAAGEHSAKGRDDFYIALLAARWKCAVLTGDRFRDFSRFRASIRPFQVYEYAHWRALAARDFVRPDSVAHARLRRPTTLRFEERLSAVASAQKKAPAGG